MCFSSPGGISSHLQKLWTELQLPIGFVHELLYQSAGFQNPEGMHFIPHFQQAYFWYNFIGHRTDLNRKWTHWRSCPAVEIVTVQLFGNWRCIYNGSNEVQNEGTSIKTQTLLKKQTPRVINMLTHLLPFSIPKLQNYPLKYNVHMQCTQEILFFLPCSKFLSVRLKFNCLFWRSINIKAYFG